MSSTYLNAFANARLNTNAVVNIKSAPSKRISMTVPRKARFSNSVYAVLTADATADVTKMAPLGDRVLVKVKEAEEKTAGGILLTSPQTPRMDDAIIGTVIAVGDEVDVGVNAGDMVLFTKYGSSDMEVPDGQVSFVAQKSILAKLS